MNLNIEVTDNGGVSAVLSLSGELELYAASMLRERLEDLVIEGVELVVVDLDGLDFMDSSGLGVLLAAHKRLQANGGRLSLVCTKRRIRMLLEVTGLLATFSVHESVSAALDAAMGPGTHQSGNVPAGS